MGSNNFLNTESGRILYHGVHEHNSGITIIEGFLDILKYNTENDIQMSKEEILNYLSKIERGTKRCTDSIDYIYKEIKTMENY